MKYLRSAILLPLLLFCGHLFAANPSYKNFDQNFFTILPDGTTITLQPGIFQGSTSGIPVFNGVGTNTTIKGGAVIANLAGSTNLYVVPQTLYVRTNGNNATGVRGSPELAWSTLNGVVAGAQVGDTIQLLGQISGSNTIYVTNVVLKGNGQWLVLSNSVSGSPCLVVTNALLQDLWITNISSADNVMILGDMNPGSQSVTNGYPIYIRNCVVQAPSIAALFKFSPQRPGPGTLDIRDSILEGQAQSLEVWGLHTYIYNCKLSVPHAHDSTENYASALTMNDSSTNIISSCVIEALGKTNGGGNTGLVLFQSSWSQFDGCVFRVDGTGGSDWAVVFSEDNVNAIFNACSFQLSPYGAMSKLCHVDPTTGNPGTSGSLEFNNCFYWPLTNGVIVDNNNVQVSLTVRGGNLKRSNFSHPELVKWLDTIEVTNVDAAYVVNTNGNVVLDVRNFTLNDELGQNSVVFGGGGKVLGLSGQVSVDWGNRELDDSSSNPTLRWGDRVLNGAWTVGNLTNSGLSGNSILGADANKKIKSVSLAGGLSFDGTTLTATGGGTGIPGTNSPICYGAADLSNFSVETANYFAETNLDGSVVLLSHGIAYSTRGFVGPSLTFTGAVPASVSASAGGRSNVFSFTPNGMLFAAGSSVNASNVFSITNTLNGLSAALYAPLTLSTLASGSRLVFADSSRTLQSATASGSIPINADGTATSASQLQAMGVVVSNDTRALTLSGSNTFAGGDIFMGHVMVGTNDTSHLINISSTSNNVLGVYSSGTDQNSMFHIENDGVQGPFMAMQSAAGSFAIGVGSAGSLAVRHTGNGVDPVGSSNVFSISSDGNALFNGGITIPTGATVTNQNFLTGVLHSDANGKETSGLLSAFDFSSQASHTAFANTTGGLGTPSFVDVASTLLGVVGITAGGVPVSTGTYYTNSATSTQPVTFAGTVTAPGFTSTGTGPAFSWTNATTHEWGFINNSASFRTNPVTGIWDYTTNGTTIWSNALTTAWSEVTPNGFTGNGGGLTNVVLFNLISYTNYIASLTIDMSGPSETFTNIAADQTYLGFSNVNPTNFNTKLIHFYNSDSAVHYITPMAGVFTNQVRNACTNARTADLLITIKPGVFTNWDWLAR